MALVCERKNGLDVPHRGQGLPRAIGRPAVLPFAFAFSFSLSVSVGVALLRGEGGRRRSWKEAPQGRRRAGAIGRDARAREGVVVVVDVDMDGLRLWGRARGQRIQKWPALRDLWEGFAIPPGSCTSPLGLDRALVVLSSSTGYRR